jgi:hypothetical protein
VKDEVKDSQWRYLENLTKLRNVTADVENAALLTECSQYAGGARIFTFWTSCPETKQRFFHHEERIREKVLNFLHSSTGCFENSALRMRQNKPH